MEFDDIRIWVILWRLMLWSLGHLHHGRQRWGAGTEGPPGRRQRQAESRPRPNWLPALELTGTSPSRYRRDLHNSGWWMGGRSLRLVLTLGVGSQLAWNGSWWCEWVGLSPGPPTGSFIKHRHPLRRRPRWSQGVAMPLGKLLCLIFPFSLTYYNTTTFNQSLTRPMDRALRA